MKINNKKWSNCKLSEDDFLVSKLKNFQCRKNRVFQSSILSKLFQSSSMIVPTLKPPVLSQSHFTQSSAFLSQGITGFPDRFMDKRWTWALAKGSVRLTVWDNRHVLWVIKTSEISITQNTRIRKSPLYLQSLWHCSLSDGPIHARACNGSCFCKSSLRQHQKVCRAHSRGHEPPHTCSSLPPLTSTFLLLPPLFSFSGAALE